MPSDHWSQSVAMFREHSTAVADGHVTAVKEVEAKLKFLSTMTLVLPMVCASYVFLGGQITREEASGVVVSPKTIHSYPRLTPALQSTLFVLAVHSGIRYRTVVCCDILLFIAAMSVVHNWSLYIICDFSMCVV